MTASDLAAVARVRTSLWVAGFRPVAVLTGDKKPIGPQWPERARQDPPEAVAFAPVPHAANTGILADGLRAIDVDIDDPELAKVCTDIVARHLGEPPIRYRGNSPRRLMVYRAAEGEPTKVTIAGATHTTTNACKIEVLGKGQQFVAFGTHPSGAELHWTRSPGDVALEDLRSVTEGELHALLVDLAAAIDAPAPAPAGQRGSRAARNNGADHKPGEPQADALRLAAALNDIPNDAAPDWEWWNRVGMAIWRATGGSGPGWKLFFAWSKRNASYTPEETRQRWDHYADSPPTSIGAGTIFHLAAEARRRRAEQQGTPPDWPEPPPAEATPGGEPREGARSRDHSAQPEDGERWPEPVDILADQDPGAAPILTERHVPAALWPFVADTAERMGVATSTVALCSIVACAAAISEELRLQPKRFDHTWTERACLWGAPIGPPGIMKTPVIALATAPIDSLEIAARKQWQDAMAVYRAAMAEWKAAGKPDPEPNPPRCARYLVESTTIEALQEVLRDDKDGTFYAPLGKVLSRQDELAEFLAGMDRYSTGKGGSDRGAYLRLYNGGRHSVDRIGRGSFVANSWSGCILGGIQPDPIQQIARNATDDGLIQRFMLDVPAPRGPGQDRSPDHTALEAYRSLFPALAALRPAHAGEGDRLAHVVLHADAHASRESIDATARAMGLWPDGSPQLQATFGKWSGLFARLCLTFHLVDIAAARALGDIGPPPSVVSAETAARVRVYMREILAPMLLRAEAIMFASRQTTHATWIASFIIAGSLARVAGRDIVQSYRRLRAPEHRDTLESTMDSLCIFGWLRPETPRGGATRPTAWRVNPAVHTRFAERAAVERARRDAVRADIDAHVAEIRGKRCQ